MNTNRIITVLVLVFVCIALVAIKSWAMNINPHDVEFQSVLNVAMIAAIITGVYNTLRIGREKVS